MKTAKTMAPPKPRRGVPRSPDAHRAILEAAITIAARGGPQAITVEAVAREAGVGKQTIYRWWPTRGLLLIEVYRHLVPGALLHRETMAGEAADAGLRRLLETLFERLRTTPAGRILAALIADAQSDPAVESRFRADIIEGRRDLLLVPIRKAIAAGALPRDTDPDWASDLVVALVWRRLLVDPEGLDRAYAARIVETLTAR